MEHETRAKGDLCFLRLPRRACMVLLTRFVLAFASFRRHCLKTRKITPVRQARCVETSAAEKNSHVFQTSLHCSTLKLIHRLPKPTSGTKNRSPRECPMHDLSDHYVIATEGMEVPFSNALSNTHQVDVSCWKNQYCRLAIMLWCGSLINLLYYVIWGSDPSTRPQK